MEAFILLLVFVATTFAADNCGVTPIYIDFHDRCVDDCFTTQYGLFIGVGTPFQNESLWPSISHNETTIASVDYCADGSSATCVNQTHGFYSPELSSSYETGANYSHLDLKPALTQGDLTTIEQTALDTLNIYEHYFDPSPPSLTRLENFPLTILSNYSSTASPWFGPGGLLGLGSSSTVLTLLHNAGLISSRSFGLYVGTAYPRAGGAINGSLTLGGYDSGRFTGESERYELSSPAVGTSDMSPYKVEVASISLTDFNNSNTTKMLSSGAFDAYLTTSQYEMTLPADIISQFTSLTSASPADSALAAGSGNNLIPLTLPPGFEGSLTISLSSGLNVTLDTNSGTLRNISNLMPLTASTASNSTVPVLGTSLLAHLYLTTHYDATPPSFYLSSAAPSGKYVITQPLCGNSIPLAYTSPRISSFARNGIVGAILGGVIGGLGVFFAAFWCVRKWMQKRAGRGWEEEYGVDRNGNAKGYDIKDDAAGAKAASVAVAVAGAGVGVGVGAGGKRAKLKGILKSSSASRSQAPKERGRKINKHRNPISAFRAERTLATATPPPKKSWSSSDSDAEGESYDMTQLQSSLPPHLGNDQTMAVAGGVGAWPLAYPQTQNQTSRHSMPGYNQAAYTQSREALVRQPSLSRSRSPSPVFSPDDEDINVPDLYPDLYAREGTRTVSFPRDGNERYANIPLTPNTPLPLPLLSGDTQSNAQNFSFHTSNDDSDANPNTHLYPAPNAHIRSSSEERRRELGLTVNTYFGAPPSTADRVGKKFGFGSQKGNKIKDVTEKRKDAEAKEGRVKRKPVSDEHNMLRRMFAS